MQEFLMFLISEEATLVYGIALFIIFLVVIMYAANKTYHKRKVRFNTNELNRLVEEGSFADDTKKAVKKLDIVPQMIEETVEEPAVIYDEIPFERTTVDQMVEEAIPIKVEPVAVIEEAKEEKVEQVEKIELEEEEKEIVELEYEDAVLSKSKAQEELEKLTLSLQEARSSQNISLTEFEVEQEENAIISLDELLKRGSSMYEANEITQYEDEGNEPISLQDLEEKMKTINAISSELATEKEQEKEVEKEKIEILDFNTIDKVKEPPTMNVFKTSPIISPIFGVSESTNKQQEQLELENTANWPKLDAEIRKTTEFIMTLKELQKKLD